MRKVERKTVFSTNAQTTFDGIVTLKSITYCRIMNDQ